MQENPVDHINTVSLEPLRTLQKILEKSGWSRAYKADSEVSPSIRKRVELPASTGPVPYMSCNLLVTPAKRGAAEVFTRISTNIRYL
jgi:hypothetical protein